MGELDELEVGCVGSLDQGSYCPEAVLGHLYADIIVAIDSGSRRGLLEVSNKEEHTGPLVLGPAYRNKVASKRAIMSAGVCNDQKFLKPKNGCSVLVILHDFDS